MMVFIKIIKRYLTHLIFHLLTLFDSVINVCGAVIGIRKVLDLGTDWLVFTETIRISNEMEKREQRKLEALEQAHEMMAEAMRMQQQDGNNVSTQNRPT